MSPRTPVSPRTVLSLLQELRSDAGKDAPLVVAGGGELPSALRRELTRGGVEAAVREGDLDGAAGLLYVLTGEAGDGDVAALRKASRARVPIVALVAGPAGSSVPDPPYVLAEHVVRVSGGGFPIERIARALARALGERGTPLAARLPVLREAVVDELIARASRQNAVVGAAVFVPGADLPVLTMNQIRLLLRIADAYGFELDRDRLPEVLGVVGGGFGLRAAARQTVGLVPVAGWLLKGAIAYGGTRAMGEAARRYFSARTPVTRVPGDRARFPR